MTTAYDNSAVLPSCGWKDCPHGADCVHAAVPAVQAQAAPDRSALDTALAALECVERHHLDSVNDYLPQVRAAAAVCRSVLAASLSPAAPAVQVGAPADPIPMVLHCPMCGLQHVDAADKASEAQPVLYADAWSNPPHRSHLCRPEDGGCGHIWRPADVPTTGVQAVQTSGKADSPIAAPAAVRVPSDAEIDAEWRCMSASYRSDEQGLAARRFGRMVLTRWGAAPQAEQPAAREGGQKP